MKRSQLRTAPFVRLGLRHLYLLTFAHSVLGDFASEPRWGQAVAVVNNLLLVSGGKTDQFGSFSYTSAPTTNDLFTLDLSQSFDPSSPSWKYISGSQESSTTQGQELAWHSLAAYNTSQLLQFGGDGGPNSPIVLPSQSNSAALLDINDPSSPNWISESEGWAGQPPRRIHHTAASIGGKVYLVGGEKDDGSSLGYSDHYVFDPSSPSFSQLPTNGGPSDIYGHGSVVLSDGRLLVFGGFSQSESQLIPFTTIWSLDTTQSSLSWSTESVSGNSVPSGRRAFAYTWLEGDKILIHGGADASLQTSLSDGWILDTTTSPMTWSNVSALSALGARRDHSAVQVGSQVLFFFGYSQNAGASVAISIFNTDSNSIGTSFSPQSGPSLTTIPTPTGTGGSTPNNPNGSGTGGTAGSNPTGGSHATVTGTGDPSSPTGTNSNGGGGGGDGSGSNGDSDKSKVATIAVASIFGIIAAALAAGVLVVIVIRRKRSQERFHLIHGDDEPESPAPPSPWEVAGIAFLPWFKTRRGVGRGEKARMTDKTEGWTVLGLGRRNTGGQRGRIDMLANEDASELGVGRTGRRMGSGSSRSWFSVHDTASGIERYGSNSSRPSIGRLFSNSFKNGFAGVRRVISGGSSRGHGKQWTDVSLPMDAFDPYEDSEGLLLYDKSHRHDSNRPSDEVDIALASRPRGGRQATSDFSKYSDPFEDRHEGEVLFEADSPSTDHEILYDSGPSSKAGHERLDTDPRSSYSTLSRSSLVPQLHPLITTASKSSSSDPSSSSLIDNSNSAHTPSTSSHQASLSASSSPRPRTTSIIGAIGAPASPVKRSDSWWKRFKRTSLRESMNDQSKPLSATMDLDFRDPNPPPGRLGAIKEASGGSSGTPESPNSTKANKGHGNKRSGSARIYSISGHEQSTTSLKTSRTADSAALERLAGRVDVAQREATDPSIDYSPSFIESTTASHERKGTWSSAGTEVERPSSPPSPDRSQDIADGAHFIDPEEPRQLVQSSTQLPSNPPLRLLPNTPSGPALSNPAGKGKGTGGVAARIADYERRMSLEISPPMSPGSPRKPRTPDAGPVPQAKRKNSSVKYGLVTRPELFIANPDLSNK